MPIGLFLMGVAIGFPNKIALFGMSFGAAIVICVASGVLAKVALSFRLIETLVLLLFALTTVAWVSSGQMLNVLIAALIGLFLSTVGPDESAGLIRFHFDMFFVSAGFTAIPLLNEIFAGSEILYLAATLPNASAPMVKNGGFQIPSWSEWKPRLVTQFRNRSLHRRSSDGVQTRAPPRRDGAA